jgi:hypothetical protein
MKECSGTHPSGFMFAQQEVMRVSLNMNMRNLARPDHVSAVLVQYVTRQALRNDRVPILDTMEVYIAGTITGEAVVHVKCIVEPHDSDWSCVVRGIEATRLEQILGRRIDKHSHTTGLLN